MIDINIVHLTYRRKHFCKLLYLILSKCTFKNFHITLNAVGFDYEECKVLCDYATSLGLSASVYDNKTLENNYFSKLNHSLNLSYKYTIKVDDDVFISPKAWDYLFNNIKLLDDDNNILLTPALSSGIPTCDDFIEHNLSTDEKEKLFKTFSRAHIPNLWGANYSKLNDLIKNNGYNTNTYYNEIRNVKHHYKGIHPARVDVNSIKLLNDFVIKNINKFNDDKSFFIKELERPYLCNSLFAIKSELYKTIINNKSLDVDGFDEVPINKYRDMTNKKFLYIPNVFGIHICYNTLDGFMKFVDYENDIFKILENKIINQL